MTHVLLTAPPDDKDADDDAKSDGHAPDTPDSVSGFGRYLARNHGATVGMAPAEKRSETRTLSGVDAYSGSVAGFRQATT